MTISSINSLTSILNTQSTTNASNDAGVHFQSYLTEALGSTTDVSALLESLGATESTAVSALSTDTSSLSSLQSLLQTAELGDSSTYTTLLNSIQSTSTNDTSALVNALTGTGATSTDASALLSGMDSDTSSTYSSLLSSLQSSNSDGYGSLLTSLSSEDSGDMLISSFKSDMFKNLNAAKAKLEGSYVDYAARIGDNMNAAQQARLVEMQNNISTITNYMSGNTAAQAYNIAKQQTTEQ